MSGFSTYLDNNILNQIFTGTAYPTPEKWWGLFTSEAGLTDDSSADWTEVKDGAYERVNSLDAEFSVSTASSVQNRMNIEFPVATADWGKITHIALMDAKTDGHVLAWGLIRNPLTMDPQPRDVYAADQFVIRANTSTIRVVDSITV